MENLYEKLESIQKEFGGVVEFRISKTRVNLEWYSSGSGEPISVNREINKPLLERAKFDLLELELKYFEGDIRHAATAVDAQAGVADETQATIRNSE